MYCGSSVKIEDYIKNSNNNDGLDCWCSSCRKKLVYDEETLIEYCKSNNRGYSKELFKQMLGVNETKLKKTITDKSISLIEYNKILNQKTISMYFSKMSLAQYTGTMVTDTETNSNDKNTKINNKTKLNIKIDKELLIELLTKWGVLPNDELAFLEDEWRDWCGRYDVTTKSIEILVKEICYQQLTIKKKREKCENVSKELNDLQGLMNSGGLKPIQESAAMSADFNTLGTWIKKFENEKPIPLPDPELQDVDNFKKYIRTWFLGHFCKFVGIDNAYTDEYDEEMLNYTIDIEEEKINISKEKHKNDIDDPSELDVDNIDNEVDIDDSENDE